MIIRNLNEYVIINIIDILDGYLNNNFLLCIIKSLQIRQKPDWRVTLTPLSSLVNIWYGVKFVGVMQAQPVAHHGTAPDQGEAAPGHDAARGVALAAQSGAWNEDSTEEKKFVYHVSLRKWNLSSRDLLMVSISFCPETKFLLVTFLLYHLFGVSRLALKVSYTTLLRHFTTFYLDLGLLWSSCQGVEQR